MMDWTYPETNDEAGIFEIGRRLAIELGRAPDVTRFIYDSREMLLATREIERGAKGGRLLTGFQTSAKLEHEIARYEALMAAGTRITVLATGSKPSDPRLAPLDYRELQRSTRELPNQWVLASDDPDQLAFVSYEIGDPAQFGVGGAAAEGKRFVGFVSDDPGVVALLITALDGVPRPIPEPAPAAPSASTTSLVADVDKTAAPDVQAGPGAVVIAVGRNDDRRAFLTGAAIAKRDGRSIILVDRSSEGFTDPYMDLRGDDVNRPSPNRLFNEDIARREGRGLLVDFLTAARLLGLEAGGWFPVKAGADGLAEAARRFGGSIFVLPPEAAKPGLAERLRGMALDKLAAQLGAPVLVAQ
jgi:hypothetical protein